MQEVGGDGFLIASNVNRRNIAEIVDGLSPALMRAGAGIVKRALKPATRQERP